MRASEESPSAQAAVQDPHAQLVLYARDLKRSVDEERKKARELAAANARLEVLDRLKTDFLNFISHELRTPLSVLATIDLLGPGADPTEQAEIIELVKHGYHRLHAFIEKGLEYFGCLSRGQQASSEVADIAAVLRRACDSLPALSDPAVDFQVSGGEAPCGVRVDGVALFDVLKALLGNALKFSPEKKIIRVDIGTDPMRVTLKITDQGIGFPPALSRELFRPFTIADVDHHGAGTGLNLALAKAKVEAYGGEIGAESRGFGKGACFFVALPRAELPAAMIDLEVET